MTGLVAGGYAGAGARGLYPLTFAADALTAQPPLAPFVNVSAGVPSGACWFLVDESANCVRLVDPARDWQERAAFASGGEAPCHLALDQERSLLAVANYGSGTVAMFRLDRESRAASSPAIFQGKGGGPAADRQEGPHAHWVGFGRDGRLYSTDLGTDRVHAFDVGYGSETLLPSASWVAPAGSGPRQLAFHPSLPIAYLVSELASTLTVLHLAADGTITAGQSFSTLPQGVSADNLGGAIAIDAAGTRLFVSNRGHDSVSAFAMDEGGEVTLVGNAPSGGTSPRFLLVHDGHVLVAHEKAGGVTALRLDDHGVPHATTVRADVPGAAFLGVSP